MVPVGGGERVFRPVIPERGAGQDCPLYLDARVAQLGCHRVGGVLAPCVIDGVQFMLVIDQAGFFH